MLRRQLCKVRIELDLGIQTASPCFPHRTDPAPSCCPMLEGSFKPESQANRIECRFLNCKDTRDPWRLPLTPSRCCLSQCGTGAVYLRTHPMSLGRADVAPNCVLGIHSRWRLLHQQLSDKGLCASVETKYAPETLIGLRLRSKRFRHGLLFYLSWRIPRSAPRSSRKWPFERTISYPCAYASR